MAGFCLINSIGSLFGFVCFGERLGSRLTRGLGMMVKANKKQTNRKTKQKGNKKMK